MLALPFSSFDLSVMPVAALPKHGNYDLRSIKAKVCEKYRNRKIHLSDCKWWALRSRQAGCWTTVKMPLSTKYWNKKPVYTMSYLSPCKVQMWYRFTRQAGSAVCLPGRGTKMDKTRIRKNKRQINEAAKLIQEYICWIFSDRLSANSRQNISSSPMHSTEV